MHDSRAISDVDVPSPWDDGSPIIADDGISLHLRRWTVDPDPRSHVLIVHGHGEHSGRYEHVAKRLAVSGHEVWAFDLRGHGQSDGQRAYVDRFSRYVADVDTVVSRVHTTRPQRPFFLLGHSMGGLIALNYALTRPTILTGVVASSPFLIPSVPVPRLLLQFANLVSAILPALPTLDISGRRLTHDEAMRLDRQSDKLVYRGRVRARTGNEMRHTGTMLLENAQRLTCPLYIFHGTADELADWTGSLVLFGRAESDDKSLTLYRDLYHEPLNEVGRGRVIASVVNWIDERCIPAATPPHH